MSIIQMQKPTHKSSNVAIAGFAEVENGRGKLRVQFLDGTLYEYDDVPQSIFNALITDKSPGGFLHKQVIGHFRHRKIENLRYRVSLVIDEVEEPAAVVLQAGNVDSLDPWSLGSFVKLKDALAYRNGMTVMAEVVNERLQEGQTGNSNTAATPLAPNSLQATLETSNSATAGTLAPASTAQSE